MATNEAIAKALLELIDEVNMDEEVKARSYSGRGMYGNKCIGVTTDEPLALVAELAFAAGSDLAEQDYGLAQGVLQALKNTRQDSWAWSTIVYWPSLKWVEQDELECLVTVDGQTCVERSPNDDYNWCRNCAVNQGEYR